MASKTSINVPREKRTGTLTTKGLEYPIENKRRDLSIAKYKLSHFVQDATSSSTGIEAIERARSNATIALQDFKLLIDQGEEVDERDKELLKAVEDLIVSSEDIIIKIKNKNTDKSSDKTRKSLKSGSSASCHSTATILDKTS